MPRAALPAVDLSYLSRGAGSDLVLVHGLGADMSFWLLAGLPALAQDHRVIAWDLRGHGRSAMPLTGYTTAQMADDLLALLDHLEVECADIVGHSFGGAIALHLAIRQPQRVRSLVLADACVPALQGVQRLRDWSEWPAYRYQLERAGVPPIDSDRVISVELLADLARRRPVTVTVERARDTAFIPFEPRGRRSAGDRWLRLIDQTSVVEDLKIQDGLTREAIRGVTTPAFALFGEHSPFIQTFQELQRELTGCRSMLLPDVGHFYPVRSPDAFVSQTLAFLAEQER